MYNQYHQQPQNPYGYNPPMQPVQPPVPPIQSFPKQKERKRKHSGKGFRIVVFSMATIALICSITGLCISIHQANKGDTPITVLNDGNDGNAISFIEGSIAEVANKVSPSVVSIIAETKTSSWFGQSSSSAAGTGVIVSADGYVLTNKHVVNGASKAVIVTDDGTRYEDVTLIGTDPLNDVAFLKINGASNLPAATLGNSKTLNAGQQVIAIGNALGQFQNTVTSGIISGTGRSITASNGDDEYYETLSDMIQTDAAINSGNSGGPLVNAAGEVIGINTAVSENGNGIGFAIPITSIKGMLATVIKEGKISRPYVGVTYTDVTPDAVATYELPVNFGAYIMPSSTIIPGSPADKAGIKVGDIIMSVNGTDLGKAGSLQTLVGEYSVGDTVQLKINRGGKEISLNITLEAYPTR